MKSNDYVIINNRAYDPVTGLQVEIDITNEHANNTASSDSSEKTSPGFIRGITTPYLHQTAQKSATLSRRYVKRPIDPAKSAETTDLAAKMSLHQVTLSPSVQKNPIQLPGITVQKSPEIQKFPTSPTAGLGQDKADRPAQTHPMIYRASNRSLDVSPHRQRVVSQQKRDIRADIAPKSQIINSAKPQTSLQPANAPRSAQVIKNQAIQKALSSEISSNQKTAKQKKASKSGRWAKFTSLATASFAIIMLAGYFTYLSMPNLSIRMAAIQSGVNAKYPGYSPDGYALRGPISFKDGEVNMKFAYAGENQGFTIKQQRSSWDSSATKQFVDSRSSDALTTNVDGLTIYTYGSNAVWVNSGVLYTLESDAPLSGDQIQRIATSM